MKKLIILVLLLMSTLYQNKANAQISLNINIGSQPLWGPVGYDHAEYYYIPEIESYYYVPKRQFIYLNNGAWVFRSTLPARYKNYNLYNGYKVVLNQDRPYLNFNTHKVKYLKYKGWNGKQKAIKFSNDKKYYVVNGHPHGKSGYSKHGKYKGNGKNGNDNKGKGKH